MTIIRTSRLSLLTLPHGQHMKQDIFGRNFIVKDSAPRAWEVELQEILSTITDPTLRQKITTILELARLGWLPQNQPSHTNTPTVPENAGSPDSSVMHFVGQTAPNETGYLANTGKYQSGMGPNIIDDRLPNPRNNSSAYVNAGKKILRGSILLQKNPNPNFLILKSIRCQSGLCKMGLTFTASDNAPDIEGDIFSRSNLEMWARQINTEGLGLTSDHSKSALDEFGVLRHAEVRCVGDYCKLNVQAELDESHPTAQRAKELAVLGRKLEFSIAANPNKANPKWSYKDKEGHRVIDDSELIHISWVNSGSNRNAKLIGVN